MQSRINWDDNYQYEKNGTLKQPPPRRNHTQGETKRHENSGTTPGKKNLRTPAPKPLNPLISYKEQQPQRQGAEAPPKGSRQIPAPPSPTTDTAPPRERPPANSKISSPHQQLPPPSTKNTTAHHVGDARHDAYQYQRRKTTSTIAQRGRRRRQQAEVAAYSAYWLTQSVEKRKIIMFARAPSDTLRTTVPLHLGWMERRGEGRYAELVRLFCAFLLYMHVCMY